MTPPRARQQESAADSFEARVKGTKFEGRTEDQVKQALYGVALQDLRNEHLDEFTKHVTDLYATYGLHYKKRLSEEERAEQQVRALFAAHPDLAAKVAPVPVPAPLVSNDPVVEPGTV